MRRFRQAATCLKLYLYFILLDTRVSNPSQLDVEAEFERADPTPFMVADKALYSYNITQRVQLTTIDHTGETIFKRRSMQPLECEISVFPLVADPRQVSMFMQQHYSNNKDDSWFAGYP